MKQFSFLQLLTLHTNVYSFADFGLNTLHHKPYSVELGKVRGGALKETKNKHFIWILNHIASAPLERADYTIDNQTDWYIDLWHCLINTEMMIKLRNSQHSQTFSGIVDSNKEITIVPKLSYFPVTYNMYSYMARNSSITRFGMSTLYVTMLGLKAGYATPFYRHVQFRILWRNESEIEWSR